MTISSHQIADRVHRITLSGLLTWTEFQTFLARVETENGKRSPPPPGDG